MWLPHGYPECPGLLHELAHSFEHLLIVDLEE